MARLIDRVRGFDVEIIDDWLLLVSSRDVVTLDPESWQKLFDAVGALSDKIDRWERWRDDRLPTVPPVTTGTGAGTAAVGLTPAPRSGRVAKRGRRLLMRLGVGERIGLLAFALLMVGGEISMFRSGPLLHAGIDRGWRWAPAMNLRAPGGAGGTPTVSLRPGA
ncbi:hypothetical protein C3B61_17330 [Cryobacterium zongtaii]|uniref:Uncharacterized protein n=2 Tax=Cryobacterium zongtaii TaxID=1259217 RepID=A0A2S3ZAW2_9MICO|nr:hypothetical protein C3B61_17330 [Cryobacterium zongtaii]